MFIHKIYFPLTFYNFPCSSWFVSLYSFRNNQLIRTKYLLLNLLKNILPLFHFEIVFLLNFKRETIKRELLIIQTLSYTPSAIINSWATYTRFVKAERTSVIIMINNRGPVHKIHKWVGCLGNQGQSGSLPPRLLASSFPHSLNAP